MKLYEKVYDISRIVFWVLYVATILNLWQKAPHYLEEADNIFKIFVGLVLIYVCNPWYEKPIYRHHKKLIFEAGIMLLLSSSIHSLLLKVPVVKKVVA
tara:strand:+ start:316 stop:609 length:294 start_codon:yes stop_codon:yes gene_type:complete